jgi:hsp70-interacting protein
MDGQTNADLSNLLRWSIENSTQPNDPTAADAAAQPAAAAAAARPATALDQDALRRILLGGPSDADRMKDAMLAIQHPDVSLPNKIVAFDNFEQLVEQIDNANNMEPLKLWQPLVEQLGSGEAEMRKWAAWCLATAVANNVKAQERVCYNFTSFFSIPVLLPLGLWVLLGWEMLTSWC